MLEVGEDLVRPTKLRSPEDESEKLTIIGLDHAALVAR